MLTGAPNRIVAGDAIAGRIAAYEDAAERMKHLPTLGGTLERIASRTKQRRLCDLASMVVGTGSGRSNSFGEPGLHP